MLVEAVDATCSTVDVDHAIGVAAFADGGSGTGYQG